MFIYFIIFLTVFIPICYFLSGSVDGYIQEIYMTTKCIIKYVGTRYTASEYHTNPLKMNIKYIIYYYIMY